MMAFGATATGVSAKKARHHGTTAGASNAELKGNNANSAGGRKHAANPNNSSGPGSGAAGTKNIPAIQKGSGFRSPSDYPSGFKIFVNSPWMY